MAGGDHAAFAAFARRIVRAYSKRVALADPEDLTDLLALSAALDEAVEAAVLALHAQGRSWAEIGRAAGVSRQAAHKRWGPSTGG